jgi:hypothetical protein
MKNRILWILAASAVMTACGGGSSGGGVLPSAPISSVTTPPIATFTLNGTVNTTGSACDGVAANCASTGAASGFNVVLGSVPTVGNGGSPIAPLYTAVTDLSGHFSITLIPAGTYEIQIGKDSTFATLHAKVVPSANGSLAYTISALSPVGHDSFSATGEQSWFTAINSYRASHGTAAIVADEYAMESSRAYAEYLEANFTTVCNPACVNYAQFGQQYQSGGGLFSYGDSYRVALSEGNCPAFAEQDSNQGPMLAASSARFGGYGYRGTTGGACAFALVGN